MTELRLAWRNVGRNPRRTLLTVAATVFAVFLVVVFVAMTRGMHEKMIEDNVRLVSGHAMVAASGYLEDRTLDHYIELAPELIERLDSEPEVEGWAPRVMSFGLLSQDTTSRGVRLLGVDPQRERSVTSLAQRIVSGRFLDAEASSTGERQIVLGRRLADRLGAGLGDEVLVYGVAYSLETSYDLFSVVGLIGVPDAELERTLAVVALSDLQAFLAYGNRVNEVAVLAESAERTEELSTALVAQFANVDSGDPLGDGIVVHPWPEVLPDLEQFLILDELGLYMMLMILVLVVGFGILNTVLMAVLERQRELGVMLALGLRPMAVFRVVFLESLMLAAVGLAVGLALAVPVALWMQANPIPLGGDMAGSAEFAGMDPVIVSRLAASTLWKSALMIFGVAALAALYPALKASRSRPVDALRSV